MPCTYTDLPSCTSNKGILEFDNTTTVAYFSNTLVNLRQSSHTISNFVFFSTSRWVSFNLSPPHIPSVLSGALGTFYSGSSSQQGRNIHRHPCKSPSEAQLLWWLVLLLLWTTSAKDGATACAAELRACCGVRMSKSSCPLPSLRSIGQFSYFA